MTKRIQISHEAPISLMSLVRSLTDVDYVLVHLCDQDPNYVKFFQESKVLGRKIIMDCSVYELGHSYDWARYDYWIRTLQPDEYVVPDVFMKMNENFHEWYLWMTHHGNLISQDFPNIKTIGVVQGNTLDEFEQGYKFMAHHADKIAISFGYGYFWDEYLKLYPHIVDLIANNVISQQAVKCKFKPEAYFYGRMKLLMHLIDNGIINYDKPHHLLGCGLPDEFRLYADEDEFSFIESIDTTHPVMTAMEGQTYPHGLVRKSDKKMVDRYDQVYPQRIVDMVTTNINYFREEICGYSKLN